MAKENPILPTPAGRKAGGGGGRKRVGEEKGLWVPPRSWHREGQGAALRDPEPSSSAGWDPFVCGQPSPSPAHNVSTFCSDSPCLGLPFRDRNSALWASLAQKSPISNRNTGFLSILLSLLSTIQGRFLESFNYLIESVPTREFFTSFIKRTSKSKGLKEKSLSLLFWWHIDFVRVYRQERYIRESL